MNFYKRMKLAYRGNIPRMEDPIRDPYNKVSKPGDGKGTQLNTTGEEGSIITTGPTSSSMGGTNARGETFPTSSPRNDPGSKQRERDIPESEHALMPPEGSSTGDGANDDRFEDPREKTVDIYKGSKPPIGPHNMQTYRSIVERTRGKLKGV